MAHLKKFQPFMCILLSFPKFVWNIHVRNILKFGGCMRTTLQQYPYSKHHQCIEWHTNICRIFLWNSLFYVWTLTSMTIACQVPFEKIIKTCPPEDKSWKKLWNITKTWLLEDEFKSVMYIFVDMGQTFPWNIEFFPSKWKNLNLCIVRVRVNG